MIRKGETFVWGSDRNTARALLGAAERLGLDPAYSVHFVGNGFRVPDAVADEAAEELGADPVPDNPDSTF